MSRNSDNTIKPRSAIQYFVIAIILSLLVWGVSYNLATSQAQRSFARASEEAQQISIFFERHVVGIFQYGDAYLKLVRREYLRNYAIADIESLMDEVPLNRSIASHITIMDENGTPLLVSGHKIKPGSTARDRDYFRHQMASSEDELYISKPHMGRNSGKLIVRLVRRYEKPNGDFGGVIFLALEADHITEFFNTMQIGPKSSATLVGTDKYIRARSTYGPKGPGQDISGSRIWKELALGPTGIYRQLSVVDNVTRYYAYRLVPGFPLIVAIGLSVEDFQQTVAVSKLNHYSIAALVTLLIVITALFFFRQQQLLIQIDAKNQELEQRADEIEAKNTELQSQNAELERFNYTVSHDLKAPLVTIKGFLGLLEKDIDRSDRDSVLKDVSQIGDAADRMVQLLNELLELSRIGRLMAAPEERGLNDLVREAVERVAMQIEARGVEIVIAPDMPQVYGDPGRLLEVLQNLIDNAVKFLGDQAAPRVEIGGGLEDGRVLCYVRDNGIGIAKEYQDRVFDLFDRLDPRVDGTGIGLALVKRIIEVHGGTIWIESDGEGQGAVFWFTLPHRTEQNDDGEDVAVRLIRPRPARA